MKVNIKYRRTYGMKTEKRRENAWTVGTNHTIGIM